MNKKIVGIRVDANKNIGAGHIMRCLTIAKALRELSCEVVFITADRHSKVFLEGTEYQVVILGTDYQEMGTEVPELKRIIEEKEISLLLVDGYFVTSSYFNSIRELIGIKIVYMDDLFMDDIFVDLLVNYNIYAKPEAYHGQGEQYALGCEYVPLREEFRCVEHLLNKDINHVLISTGAADSLNISTILLKRLTKKFPKMSFHVVCGALNTHLEELLNMEAQNSNIHIHYKVTNMAELMKGMDVAISAAGSTMYEIASVGIPIITFYFVENQRRIAETFGEQKLAFLAGDYQRNPDGVMLEIERDLERLITNPGDAIELSRRLRKLVDGEGARRIAERIIKV